VAILVELVTKRIISTSELLVSKHASTKTSMSCTCIVDLHAKCILLIEDILLILIVFILAFIFILFLLVILIAIPNVLMSHSEHILMFLLSMLSELLLFPIILIITVHLLILIGRLLSHYLLLGILLKLSLVEGFLGLLLGLPLLLDLIRVFKEGQRMD
jgi:hypothetical protein